MASKFHPVDYAVFAVSLLIPLGIGVFFKLHGRKRQTTSEYLLGGRQMGCIVLGFSLMASFFNAVFLIGAPAEVYYFGLLYTLVCVPYVITCVINCALLVPFFRRFTYSSGYEYLEHRYRSKIPRLAGAVGFSLHMLSFLAVVMYAPALVFNQVSGVNMNIAIACCGLVCVAYTFMGGIKAVLWTDAVQTLIILVCFAVMSAMGISRVGGWSSFTHLIQQSSRINYLTLDMDLTTRHTFWTQMIGGFFVNLCFSNQIGIQRFLAAKSTRAAQVAYMVNMSSACVLTVFTAFLGLIVYAYFSYCDPIIGGFTSKPDQLLPHFVMEVFGTYPGIPGCFIAAIFAAALSTVSSIVNSLSLVTVEDFIKPLYSSATRRPLTDKCALLLSQAFTAVYGIASICLAFGAPYMGPVLIQIPQMLISCIGAPMNVLFAMSIFWPHTNVWGATGGSVLGLTSGLLLALCKMVHGIRPSPLPLGQCIVSHNVTDATTFSDTVVWTTEMSTVLLNETIQTHTIPRNSIFESLGAVSYMWYPVVTWVITVTSCVLLSAIAKCLCLPGTDTSYVYDKGLVYYGYKPDKRDKYKQEMESVSDPVLLKHFNTFTS